MYPLETALVLSPGNKAQTTKNGVIYVVKEYPGSLPEPDDGNDLWHQYQLYVIRHEDTLRSNGQYRLFEDFVADLERSGLDRFALIWHPIMNEDLLLQFTIERQGNDGNYYPFWKSGKTLIADDAQGSMTTDIEGINVRFRWRSRTVEEKQ